MSQHPLLLERDGDRQILDAAVERAGASAGSVVLISGEAGIGKTSLVRDWLSTVSARARTLVGACDDLVTPRTLGPFRDAVRGTDGPLTRAFAGDAGRDALLTAVQEEVANPLRPTVVVLEDVHWADEATLDVLRFLGRRIATEPTVLVATYRDDLPDDHPLRRVLGDLTGAAVHRVALHRLTRAAVATLAGADDDRARGLYALTGGNPFLLTEVLAAGGDTVPATVRDAVAARLREVSRPTHEVLEQLAVLPGGVEPALLGELLPGGTDALAEAERRGIIEFAAGRARFCHELTRQAVEATCPVARLTVCHARALSVLRAAGAEPSRLVHHALAAGDVETVAEHAPVAARRAARAGAHLDAVRFYDHALTHGGQLAPEVRAALQVEHAHELFLANRLDEATERAEEAVLAWRQLDDPAGLGRALTTASNARYWGLRANEAVTAAEEAVAVLEPAGDSADLASACSNLAFVLVMTNQFADAVAPARRAAEIAAAVGDAGTRSHALTQEGVARVQLGDEDGLAVLQTALELARGLPHHEHVASACIGLVSGSFRLGRVADAERHMQLGLEHAAEHVLQVGAATLRMMRHGLDLSRGSWSEAGRGLRDLVGDGRGTGWGETVAGALLGRLRARCDEPDAGVLIERAWELATRSGEVQRVGPAGAAWAEWGWLTGGYDSVRDRVERAITLARGVDHGWYLGELLRYRALVEGPVEPGDDVPEPWASGLRGDWRAAASGWQERGWPYEQALELASSDREPAVVEGLSILDQLGASATATLVRRRLRELGVQRIPRGPRTRTRHHPAGLTARQSEVLQLLAAGATNPEIADRLALSVRTVDHHVTAILNKLGVASRRDAAVRAAELGLTSSGTRPTA